MGRDLKRRAALEIAELLRWCLATGAANDAFDGDEPFEAVSFGMRFLDRFGFRDGGKRFWSSQPPALPEGAPEPGRLARRLAERLDRLSQTSERADTTATILRTAVCLDPTAGA